MAMKKSKLLAEQEATQQSVSKMPDLEADASKFIQPDSTGVYRVQEVNVLGDYVAIAPLRRASQTEGGIIVAGMANEPPDTGIVVGKGDVVGNLLVGQHVKFIPKHKAADLTENLAFYNGAQIAVYKLASVIAILDNLKVESA